MSHITPCITNVLPDVASCTYRDEHLRTCMGFKTNGRKCSGCDPRPATRGEVCERCYEQIDYAIQLADTLRRRLDGVDHAMTAEPGSDVAGPRLPLTAIRLAFDEIDRYQKGHTDPLTWVQTEQDAADAVRFAHAVRRADRAHPTVEAERKMQRLRCPQCSRLTATWQPPDWPGDDVTIACISCGWEATNPDSLNIVASIESKGHLDDSKLLMLALSAQRRAARMTKGAA